MAIRPDPMTLQDLLASMLRQMIAEAPETLYDRVLHEPFGGVGIISRRLALRFVETLRREGYGWARIPKQEDQLYKAIAFGTDCDKEIMRDLFREDSKGRLEASREIARRIVTQLDNDRIAIVRRHN